MSALVSYEVHYIAASSDGRGRRAVTTVKARSESDALELVRRAHLLGRRDVLKARALPVAVYGDVTGR